METHGKLNILPSINRHFMTSRLSIKY